MVFFVFTTNFAIFLFSYFLYFALFWNIVFSSIVVKLQDLFLSYNWWHKNLLRTWPCTPSPLEHMFSGTGLKCFLICIFLTSTIGVGFFYLVTTLISAISSTSIVKLSLVVFFLNKQRYPDLFDNFVSICCWNYS